MSNNTPLSEFNFGEYDARREFLRGEAFFLDSFIDPMSFQLKTLNNNQNFIIVGQKGAGKTACQIYLEYYKEKKEGYICDLISFYDDLKAEDYRDFAKTQKIQILELSDLESIELLYDFKEVWKRLIFLRIARLLKAAGFDNTFVSYCESSSEGASTLLDGLKKSLKVEVKIPLASLETKVAFDPSVFQGKEISITDFNRIAESLLRSECGQYRLYFFIDELVISTYNVKSDEYKIRAALIRDLVRICCYFNDTCVKYNLDLHFICNLRPEIRTLLNSLDPEISKIMDGNDVFLSWDNQTLYEIMIQKIVNGAPCGASIDADAFLPDTIKMGKNKQDFVVFLLNQTWRKPRDIIRFLKCYAKMNPSDCIITEEGTKRTLNEYARVSAVEIFEQLSVDFSQQTLEAVRAGIRSRSYSNAREFGETLRLDLDPRQLESLLQKLYQVGVIGNLDERKGSARLFFYHRQEENLDPDMQVIVHNGLWNYFNIRHR